ncbi:MAG: hypothetical protein R3B53_00980 [Candidatus Paceibacterota bacterium]
MKTLLSIGVVIVLALVAFSLWSPGEMGNDTKVQTSEMTGTETSEVMGEMTQVEGSLRG